MLRDLQKDDDDQLEATIAVIAQVAPDVVVLTDFDYDLDGLALSAFAGRFDPPYRYVFALQPNTGIPTGYDIDRNGRLGDARDAQGYGRFAGDGGLAIMSRFAIMMDDVQDYSGILWKDLPGAVLPQGANGPFLTAEVQDVQRLSTSGHWVVPVALSIGAPVNILAFSATPPVFDGPEDRNGLRNRDELRLWGHVLRGYFGPAPSSFVIAGNANLDPQQGDGFSGAMVEFLQNPLLKDPLPNQNTADWPEEGPGNLRVSYVLPSRDWIVKDAGVFWPAPDDPLASLLGGDGLAAGPHHLVWVDISR